MTTEHVWNGLRVRRNEQGKWMYRSGHVDSVWLPLSIETGFAPTLHAPIIAELDKLYPKPRTVTLNNGDVWTKGADGWWSAIVTGGKRLASHRNEIAVMLDRIWELENGDDR